MILCLVEESSTTDLFLPVSVAAYTTKHNRLGHAFLCSPLFIL